VTLEPLDGYAGVLSALGAAAPGVFEQAPPPLPAGSLRVGPHSFPSASARTPPQELRLRELCRRRLAWFAARFTPDYECGWVHWHLARRLEVFRAAVASRRSPRLMVFFPPRHGKTRKVSICFPAWLYGRHPSWDVILASYSSDLAERSSRAARELVASPEYAALFPGTAVAAHARAVNDWETTAGGQVRAAGVGGTILGMGAHVLVVDDPVKNLEEADSESARSTLWGWHGAVATTRLAPGGGVALIQQRWRHDDLCGALLSGQAAALEAVDEAVAQAEADYAATLRAASASASAAGAGAGAFDPALLEAVRAASAALRDARDGAVAVERWEVFKYAALAPEDEFLTPDDRIVRESDLPGPLSGPLPVLPPQALPDVPPPGSVRLLRRKGEALHPERYGRVALLRHKLAPATQPRHWAAMYQQDPRPEEGAFFDPAALVWRGPLSEAEIRSARVFLAGDLAISTRKSAARTAFAVLAALPGPAFDLAVLEWTAGRWGTWDLVREAERLVRRWRPWAVGLEREKITLTFLPVLQRHFKSVGLRVRFDETLVPIGDKEARARALQGALERGRVHVVGERDSRAGRAFEAAFAQFPTGPGVDLVDALSWGARMAGASPPRGRGASGRPRASGRSAEPTVAERVEAHFAGRAGAGGLRSGRWMSA